MLFCTYSSVYWSGIGLRPADFNWGLCVGPTFYIFVFCFLIFVFSISHSVASGHISHSVTVGTFSHFVTFGSICHSVTAGIFVPLL